jgi:deoxyribodipyrimidine photolyase
LSIREVYHKLVDKCYNGNILDLSNSKLMSYLVRRDYNSQTPHHLLNIPAHQIQSTDTRINASPSDLMGAKSGVSLIDTMIRQIEIQGTIHPYVKRMVYSFVRDIVLGKLTDNKSIFDEYYFQKLLN